MNFRHILMIGLVCLPFSAPAQRQSSPESATTAAERTGDHRGIYQVVLTAGGGSSLYQNFVGIPSQWQNSTSTRRGSSYSFRAMWYPDHRLRTGLETGLTTFYAYQGTVNGELSSVTVSAIPMLVVFSMPLGWHNSRQERFWDRMSLTGGMGGYLIRSELVYKGVNRSQEFSLGWMAAASYVQPLGRSFGVGIEARWLAASATKESDYALQLQLQWRAFRW